ncbi:hypothetical protein GOA58_05905 [Sinorhizobium meliloti]|uniref:hypothetical protein n=1 Tax=Rhizobium meliloti TaxID=382 RepID=UPI00299EB215|nr:hypothetical protein [Sinorhizobium meliloti]MDW9660110.1 hypothetical protein [Sinorhizobium meliloti]MDX0049679.1 hypothetical protein [Sinorhizobium meliloti]
MKRFTVAGRNAISAKNWYAGLSLALTLPDICASLEDPGPNKSAKRYIAWCEKWLKSRFGQHLSAADIYQLRCSLVHSGSAEIKSDKVKDYSDFEFFDDTTGSHLNFFKSVISDDTEYGNFIQLSAENFSLTVFDAVDEWESSIKGNQAILKEKEKLISIRSSGYSRGPITFGSPAQAPPKDGVDIIHSRAADGGTVALDIGPVESPYSLRLTISEAIGLAATIMSTATVSFNNTGAASPAVGRDDLPLHEVIASSYGLVIRADNISVARLAFGFGNQAVSINLTADELLDLSREAGEAAKALIDIKKGQMH